MKGLARYTSLDEFVYRRCISNSKNRMSRFLSLTTSSPFPVNCPIATCKVKQWPTILVKTVAPGRSPPAMRSVPLAASSMAARSPQIVLPLPSRPAASRPCPPAFTQAKTRFHVTARASSWARHTSAGQSDYPFPTRVVEIPPWLLQSIRQREIIRTLYSIRVGNCIEA